MEKLLDSQLRHDLGWLEKDLRALRMLGTLAVTLVPADQLQADALEGIRRWVCGAGRMGRAASPFAAEDPRRGSDSAKATTDRTESAPYLTAKRFAAAVEQAKQDLRGLVPKLGDWLKEIFTLRLALETHAQPYPGLAEDLAALLPPDFLRTTPFERVRHLPRYLRGRQVRTDRWKRDAAKDAQRAAELAPFVRAVAALYERRTGGHRPPLQEQAVETFRWLVEEFRVSLFAQELGTAEPVSAVRLKRALDELQTGRAASPFAAEEARRGAESAPYLKPSTAAPRKGAPLKSLGSLDQLFRK